MVWGRDYCENNSVGINNRCVLAKYKRSVTIMEKTIRMYESPVLAQSYSKYRPTYPQTLWNKIFDFAEKHGTDSKMALDLACGTGLSTFGLCGHYQRTVGVDISKAQLEYAKEELNNQPETNNNVEFILSTASRIPIKDESADLVTCATAWHWLDPNTVFPEVDRVLKSPGTLAVYSYCAPKLLHEECNDIFQKVMNTCTWQEGPYGNVFTVCNSHYQEVRLPYPISERHEMEMRTTLSLDDIEGFILSLDSYQTYCRDHPNNTLVIDMVAQMSCALATTEENTSKPTVTMATPYFLLLAVKV